ncbi:MAG: FAD-dependent oxidoreductase [Flavobacteriales bacterium]|nr:FAD-dependent oxidoreductase [Flavobacteriales bacterium]
MTNNNYDVVIVGAGFSGLSAAIQLKEKGKSFIVLEARNRVGGRSWTEQYIDQATGETCWIDMGAQWVEKTQTEIIALADKMNIRWDVDGQPRDGKLLFIFKNEPYEIEIGKAPNKNYFPMLCSFMETHFLKDFQEYHEAEKKMDKMAGFFDSGYPWKASKGAQKDAQKEINEWDSMTAQSWMNSNMKTDGAKFLFRIKCLLCFAVPPSDISFLHVLHYINCAGLSATLSNATQYRIEGGTQAIADAVYRELSSHIRLNEPVRQVHQPDPNLTKSGEIGITLVKTDLHTYKAKQVIMAIPPAIVPNINFIPQLPARRVQFNQRMPMGSSIKCHLVYDKPFWEDKGYCGIAISDSHLVPFIANNSIPGREKPAVLGCFIDSTKVRDLMNMTDEELEKLVTEEIRSVFKHVLPTVPKPKKVYIANWSKEIWSGGCYAGIMPPGVWTGYKNTLRESVGAIHWATTETSPKWFAYMEGAVRAGKTAADNVPNILKKE